MTISRHGLSVRQCEQLTQLLRRLERDSHAPTTVRDPLMALDRHVNDALVALEIDPLRAASRVADIGSGAGFPGIPLAIALPEARFTLVESQRRKATYLRATCNELGLDNVEICNQRIELCDDLLGRCDVVTARALAAQPVVLEYAAPLLRRGGCLLDWRGERTDSEPAKPTAAAAEILGLVPNGGLRTNTSERTGPILAIFKKVRDTPERFPRRPGVASRNPLGEP